jgi:hypothetical protein
MQSGDFTQTPTVYGGCCLSLSTNLFMLLQTWLSKEPKLVLSIGCGTGLLEAALVKVMQMNVEGVEVSSHSGPQHLASNRIHYVGGYRELFPRAIEASSWLWVYPRQPDLFKNYLEQYSEGAVEVIVWLGPKQDWPDYEQILKNSSSSKWHTMVVLQDNRTILAGYELAALIEKA